MTRSDNPPHSSPPTDSHNARRTRVEVDLQITIGGGDWLFIFVFFGDHKGLTL